MTKRRILCNENGFIYDNVAQIARDLDLNYDNLASYFRCMIATVPKDNVDGYTFKYLEE